MYSEMVGPGPRISRWQNADIVAWEDWTFERFQASGLELECPLLIRFYDGGTFRFAAIIKKIHSNSKIELQLQKLDDNKEECVPFDEKVSIEQAIIADAKTERRKR